MAGIDVEDIVGDEARVDAAFAEDAARAVLPVLAKATEALCGLEGVELEDVRGGTFIRQRASGFAWLPGLVRVPSPAFKAERDASPAALKAKHAAVEQQFGLAAQDRYDVDLAGRSIVFSRGGEPRVLARATLIATFSRVARSWAWGGYNKNLPEPARAASAALADEIPDRDMWEVSTPVFPADEGTAWVLAALVCDRCDGETVHASPIEEGQGARVPAALRTCGRRSSTSAACPAAARGRRPRAPPTAQASVGSALSNSGPGAALADGAGRTGAGGGGGGGAR